MVFYQICSTNGSLGKNSHAQEITCFRLFTVSLIREVNIEVLKYLIYMMGNIKYITLKIHIFNVLLLNICFGAYSETNVGSVLRIKTYVSIDSY